MSNLRRCPACRSPVNRLSAVAASLVLKRLERAEAEFLADLASWEALCRHLLPEHFAEPDVAITPSDSIAGSESRVVAMIRRASAGVSLWCEQDRQEDADDRKGLLWPQSRNGNKRSNTEKATGRVIAPTEISLGATTRLPDQSTTRGMVTRDCMAPPRRPRVVKVGRIRGLRANEEFT